MKYLVKKSTNSLQIINSKERNMEIICTKDADAAKTKLRYIGAISDREYVYIKKLGTKDIYIIDSISAETLYTLHYNTCDVFQCVIDKKKENLIITGYDMNQKPTGYYIGVVNLKTKKTKFTETPSFVSSHTIKLSDDERYFYYSGVALDENDSKQLISTVYRYDINKKTTREVVYTFRNRSINSLSVSPDGKYVYVQNGMSMTKISTDTSVKMGDIFWPYRKSVVNMYSKYCEHNDILITSCSDNYINMFNTKTNRQLIYLNMLDILEYSNTSEREMIEELEFGITTEVYISESCNYLCLLYIINSRGTAYADILNIDSMMVVNRISSKKFHWISNDFMSAIKDYGFIDNDKYEIEHRYRALVLSANNAEIDSMQISYSQDANIVAFAGKDADHRHGLFQINLNNLSFSRPKYFKRTTSMRPYCYSDYMLLHRIGYNDNEMLKLDYQSSEILDRQDANTNIYNGFSAKYTAIAIDDNTKIKINDNSNGTIKVIKNDDTNQHGDYTWAWSNNTNVLYTKGSETNIKRWEINKIINNSYRPTEYDISHVKEYLRVGSLMNESANGKYIALRDKDYLVDSQKGDNIGRFERKLEFDLSVFIENELKFILSGGYRRKVYFTTATTNELLAEVSLLTCGRVIIRTKGDSLAKDGWIYTNCEDVLNIYIKNNDGTIQLLNPGDELRRKYLHQYLRKDMIKDIIYNYDKYHKKLSELKLMKKKEYLIEMDDVNLLT